MMTPRYHCLVCTLALLAACDGDPYAGSQDLLPPVTTRDSLVWVDRGHDEVVFVLPTADGLDVRRRPLGDERTAVAWSVATRDRASVLALTLPESAKQEDVDEQLHRMAADGTGDVVAYDVRAPFSSVALSPDRRRAVLYFGADVGTQQLHNANQVAIVDLAGDDARNVTLNGFGGALRAVQFPGQIVEGERAPIVVAGVEHDIVAFLAASEIVLLDMDDPALDQVAIPLGMDIGFAPSATLLRPGNALFPDPALFVRSSSGAEIGMLTLLGEADGSGFTAQISLLSVGKSGSDFVLHDSGEVPYLISTDPVGSALTFTDIRTQGGFAVMLATHASALFLRDAEVDGSTVRQVVAWHPGGVALSTLDLGGIEDSLTRKPRQLKIETGVESLVQLDNDRALIGSGTRLYVVDFRSEQVTPLSSNTPYDALGSALVGDRLLLGTAGQQWVSTVDLETLNPESMLLDDPITSFHYLPGPGRIVVTHDEPIGQLTVIDPADPARSTSRVHWGFLLSGVLDRTAGS
jgi:hypothetical protein